MGIGTLECWSAVDEHCVFGWQDAEKLVPGLLLQPSTPRMWCAGCGGWDGRRVGWDAASGEERGSRERDMAHGRLERSSSSEGGSGWLVVVWRRPSLCLCSLGAWRLSSS